MMELMNRRDLLKITLLGSSVPFCNQAARPDGPKPGSLLIRGGRIVTEERQWDADILVEGETIVEVGTELKSLGWEERIIDASGLNVLPGGIDPHAHLSRPWVDDYTSGSRAAFAGGITTIGSMIGVREGERLLDALTRETERVQAASMADIVLHPIISRPMATTVEELSEIVEAGHRSIKIFMVTDRFVENESTYRAIIQEAGRLGLLTLLHCEDAELLDQAAEKLRSEGRTSLLHYAESRPIEAEVAATRRAVEICARAGNAPIYVVHLSSKGALVACRAAKERKLPVFVETRPLYLHFTKERFLDSDGPLFVGQPPLRDKGDVEALWDGLANGSIDTIGTDHAPWTREQKMDPDLDIFNLRPGVADLQTMLPVLYSQGVLGNRLTLERFVAVTSTNAAKLMGLYPKKGTIAVGSEADLTLWDPTASKVIRREGLFSNAGFSLFEGEKVRSWPRMTIRRGEVVYEGGRILALAGSGRVPRRGEITAPSRSQSISRQSEH
jgi:dihydropyrimidinase